MRTIFVFVSIKLCKRMYGAKGGGLQEIIIAPPQFNFSMAPLLKITYYFFTIFEGCINHFFSKKTENVTQSSSLYNLYLFSNLKISIVHKI